MPRMPPDALVRDHVERILASRAFGKADRLRALLLFVVEKTLAGQRDTIKEYTIALEVCGRASSFDPKTDPIVRVDANRLRARLDAYYRLEGRDDAIRIHLPKGSYVPTMTSTGSAPRPAPQRGASLVVLPFVSLGPHGDDASFADGLTEELIHQLSCLSELRVIARTSAFQYRSQGGDLRRIASDLRVAYVVEGSVRWARDQIRVTVQLTEVQNCGICWSGQYERSISDVLAVQDDICRNIARAVQVQLVDQPSMASRSRPEPRAHIEYLKGRYFWNRRTPSALAQSIEHYRRAIELDPRYAPAQCGIADTILVQALNEQVDARDALSQALTHTQQALLLAPDLSESLVSAAAVASILEWDWPKGNALFRRAIDVNPRLSIGHHLYAVLNLSPCARWDEALIAMDRAIELDPVSPVLHRDLGIVHYLRGEYRDADEALQSACTLDPSFRGSLFWLGRTLCEQGRLEEALHVFEARLSEPGANTRVLASVVHTLGMLDRRAEARERFHQLEQLGPAQKVPALTWAIGHLGLAQHDQALMQLERACAERSVPLYQIAVDPIFRPLRGSVRFHAILSEMRLDQAVPSHR